MRWIIEDRYRSPERGRLQWANTNLHSQSPSRNWKSMLDVSGGKSGNLTPPKLVLPKTPTILEAGDRPVGSNWRPSSPSPLHYGIEVVTRAL